MSSWIDGLLGGINKGANSINPFKGGTDWLTHNTLSKIPVIGKPLGQAADWGDSHPAQIGAAIGAAFGGEALLGAGAGGAAGGAAGAGEAGAGAGFGGLGTASGFGGAGVDAGATGFGSWGASAGGADVGGLASLDSAAVGSEGAAPGLTEGYGSASGFDWQGMLKDQLKSQAEKQLKSGGSSSGGSSSGGASSSGGDSGSPDYFSSLFTFGPGSVSTKQTTPTVDYPAMLLNGLG